MQVDEVWAYILEFPGYAVSSHGRVKNLRTDRILRPSRSSYGKLFVSLRKDGVSYTRYIHRLVAKTFLTGFNDHLAVFHNDDNGENNIVTNLVFRKGQRMGTIRRISEDPQFRRVVIVETGQVFRTVSDLARYLETDRSNVYKVLRGERSQHLGYTFEVYDI